MDNSLLDNYLDKDIKSFKKKFLTKVLICIILILSSLIFTSYSDKNLVAYKKYIFENTFNFMKFNNFYESIAHNNILKEDIPVFKSEFNFSNGEKYLDGIKYKIDADTPIKAISSGIVVYKGDKEGYKNSIIIQGSNGFDILYGNLESIDINIYDYIKDDKIIGNCSDELYLLISKDGKYYTYEEYQNNL